MKSLITTFILLILPLCCKPVLCNDTLHAGTADSETLELPRQSTAAASREPPWRSERMGSLGNNGFRIVTVHYSVTADRQEDGVQIGTTLEHLYCVWQLLGAQEMAGQKIPPASRRHNVRLFNNKEEYVRSLRRIAPAIAVSNGYYCSPQKTAYFFSLESKIVFHEGTHQILMEHFFPEKSPSFRNNFWVTEGIALLLATLKVENTCYKIGDILADRLYSAKVYWARGDGCMPIRTLTAMSAGEIQARTDLQQIYSQSAAIVHWLMFAEKGRYRGALFELLRQTYRDEALPGTLSELTGLSYEELDRKYEEFLKTIPDEAAVDEISEQ